MQYLEYLELNRLGTAVARLAFAWLAASALTAAAAASAVVTLVEDGGGRLLRSGTLHPLVEGVHIQSNDIIEVAGQGLVQLEFADGIMVSLGAHARFCVIDTTGLYLLRGVAKLKSGMHGAPLRVTTPLFGLYATAATVVVRIDASAGMVFVESGQARLAEGFAAADAASPIRLQSEDFYARTAGRRGSLSPAIPAAFVAALPAAYIDDLPLRIGLYRDAGVPLPQGRLASFGEAEPWLKVPPALRRPLLPAFAARAADPAFRDRLILNHASHPEWDVLLLPEKIRFLQEQRQAMYRGER